MEQEDQPLIRMHFWGNNPVLTIAEFDQLDRTVTANIALGDATIGDLILAELLHGNRDRANDCRDIMTTRSKCQALADHLLLDLDDRIHHYNGDTYQAHEARWKVTGDGPYEFELLKDS